MKTTELNKSYILHSGILGRMLHICFKYSCPISSRPFHVFCQLLSVHFIHLFSTLSDFLSVFQIPEVPDLPLTLGLFFASFFTALPQAEVVASNSDVTLWQHLLQQDKDQTGVRNPGEGRHVQTP